MRGDLETLQRLYDSEINWKIECFWDGGFQWHLGDEMNGFTKSGATMTLPESVAELSLAAHAAFPDSKYHLGEAEFRKRFPPAA